MKSNNNVNIQSSMNAHEFFHEISLCLKITIIIISALLLFPATNSLADNFSSTLSFNVPPDAPNWNNNSGTGGLATIGAGNDGTYFYQDRVTVGGTLYAHVIIGQPAQGFAFEYYTRSAGGLYFVFSPDSGGNELSSGSTNTNPNGSLCDSFEDFESGSVGMCGNGADPLNNSHDYNLSGTGTGDGSKMAMHMVMDYGDGMSLEVYKPVTDRKPLITQTVIDGDMRSEFISDMRALSYNDLSSAAPLINRQTIDDATIPTQGAGDFDMSMVQDSNVTAGRFIFTAGAGWSDPFGWRAAISSFDEGVYTYAEDSFDVLNVPWADYFNYSDNATACNTGQRFRPTMLNDPGGPSDSCPQ